MLSSNQGNVSRSVLEGRAVVESVARNKRLQFYWVPGAKGIDGSELVDDNATSDVRLLSDR